MTTLHPKTVQNSEKLAKDGKRARRKKPVQRTPRVSRVKQTKIAKEVMRVALKLANGDRSRLKLHNDGSVTVMNKRHD